MSTYYVSPVGDDNRTTTAAKVSSTPWRTVQHAWHSTSVIDGDEIRFSASGVYGAEGCLHTKGGTNNTGTNVPKRLTIRVPTGISIEVRVPWQQGVDRANTGTDYGWIFVNPNQVKVIVDGTLDIHHVAHPTWPVDAKNIVAGTDTSPANNRWNSSPEDCAAFAFVYRSGNAGPTHDHNSEVTGLKVSKWMGAGINFKGVEGCHARDVEVMGCAQGFRAENTDGARVTTSLLASSAQDATTVSLSLVAGISVGDLLVIDTWPAQECRSVTAINGSTVTLGGWKYPRGVFVQNFPLEFSHAQGVVVTTQYGVSESWLHDNNENTRGVSNPNDGDVGAEALIFSKGARNMAAWGNLVHDNYDDRLGCVDYNIDGTGMDPYAMKAGSRNVLAWNDFHDNHAWIESGTDQNNLAAGNTNGGLLVYRNYIWGKIDFNDASPINPNTPPTASLILMRACPEWMVRHNTCYITNGPAVGSGTSRGGIRFRAGGNYGGTRERCVISDNLLVYAVDSRLLDYTTVGAYPAEHQEHHNLLYRPNGGTDAAAVSPNNTQYPLSAAGLTSWRADTPYGDGDIWAQDPLLVNPATGDLRLNSNSPAQHAASDGGAIGAHAWEL